LLHKNGRPLALPQGHKFIDFSLPQAREYMENLVRITTEKWGYEGFKFDFWSDHFHCVDVRYRDPEWTGTMLRDWFLGTLRKYVGESGFILTCCGVGNGNPFIGQYADSFRCGIDIGEGKHYHGQVATAFWTALYAKFGVSRFIRPDIDSMGDLSRFIPASVHRLWNSFSAISGTHLEYGGRINLETPDLGKKAAELFSLVPFGQLGQAIDFPQPLQGSLAPMVWVNTDKSGKRCCVAVCNWHENRKSKPFALYWKNLGIKTGQKTTVTELWSEKKSAIDRYLKCPAIPARDAVFYVIEGAAKK